ncbi:MAG: zinc ribbon domain-containing protein [Nitrospirae bacterium]|nr:MAG: zinc ribbon domain-containing protein [Nitrospirota bacterium]
MPIFEYVCQECRHKFEMIVQGSTVPACPSCKTTKLEKQISGFAVGATEGWAPSGGPGGGSGSCGSCGDPRGPGACSMN